MGSSPLRHTIALCLGLVGCGEAPPGPVADAGVDASVASCTAPPTLQDGDPSGHPEPLGAGPGEARAGRIDGARLPPFPSGLGTWEEGGFVLANDRVAMVIEDEGPSNLYDPWGGRPLGIGRVVDGAIVDPADFGEILLLAGRYTVMTTRVSVLADGRDGGPAIVRARGPMRALPFYEAITAELLPASYDEVTAAIDYVLAPDSNVVEIHITYASASALPVRSPLTLHGFMYTPRMPGFAPQVGFDASSADAVPWLGFTDERGVSYAYAEPRGMLRKGVEASGFVSRLAQPRTVAACALTETHHASITVGAGRGVDALLVAVAGEDGQRLRTVRGIVRDAAGAPADGVRVHATRPDGTYLSRSLPTGPDGAFELHVPEGGDAQVQPFRQGDAMVPPTPVPGAAESVALTLSPGGTVRVRTFAEDGASLPSRIQVQPRGDSRVPSVPGTFGEELPASGRLHTTLSATGEATLRLPVGTWRVTVSRGYEYELETRDVEITAEGDALDVDVTLVRVVETPGVQCADFHIHTRRSNDSDDDVAYKVRGALADGLEIPVRSDHEYAADFTREVAALDAAAWASGVVGSVEMSSMEIWGHMGVVPLTPDPDAPNGGAPVWQEWPTPEAPTRPLRTMSPVEVFDAVRARPEAPTVIINHPLGSTNYFGYAGYDPATGEIARPDVWDDEFTAVEFFNDADWLRVREAHVRNWLSLLDRGRRIFAVGSSDSHGLRTSPVGYPRTCLALGTDVPSEVTPSAVRDAVAQGHSTISGGIYVEATVGAAGAGDDVTVGAMAMLHVRVQAASWVDVDALDIVVDGVTRDTVEILPGDAPDPLRPHVRFEQDLPIEVADGRGSYVLVAAYGDQTLEPVHPGRIPFGVTNPVFLHR